MHNSSDTIDQLNNDYEKEKVDWQKEKNELLTQIANLNYQVEEMKNKNNKLEKERDEFKNNFKRYIQQVIDEKMNQLNYN